MNVQGQSEFTKTGMERLAGLLRSPDGMNPAQQKEGYIDALGERDALGPHQSQQAFGRKALPPVYERIWRPLTARVFFGLTGPRAATEREMTVEMLDLSAEDRVLDVGCGPGNYTRRLAQDAPNGLTVGIDASAAMVTAATKRENPPNIVYARADASALPFRDEAFDVVCCVGVIHMTSNPMAALDEMVRVLAPGGRLAIVATCGRKGSATHVRKGITVFSRDQLTGALIDHGLVDVGQRVIRRGQFVSARREEI
jgi:SAM-dependent methyltransferase